MHAPGTNAVPASKKCPSFCWPCLHQFGRSMARTYQCLCVHSPADRWIPSIAGICTCISRNYCRSHQHHACQEGVQRERGAQQEHQPQQQHQQQQPAVLRQAAAKRQRTMQPPGAAMGPSIVTVVQCCHMIVCHGLLCISDKLMRLCTHRCWWISVRGWERRHRRESKESLAQSKSSVLHAFVFLKKCIIPVLDIGLDFAVVMAGTLPSVGTAHNDPLGHATPGRPLCRLRK